MTHLRTRVLIALALLAGSSFAQSTTLVSVGWDGSPANGESRNPSISADGRFVAFESNATNLVPGDTNRVRDVFVFDLATRTTARVSVASDGTEANASSGDAYLSADGRVVAFQSRATNLASAGLGGIFAHDRPSGRTILLFPGTYDPSGRLLRPSEPVLSGDGSRVAFTTGAWLGSNVSADVRLTDRRSGDTWLASANMPLEGGSFDPALSADGRYVAFLFAPVGAASRAYIFDSIVGTATELGSATANASNLRRAVRPSISAHGGFVAIERSTGLVNSQVFVVDRRDGTATMASVDPGGAAANRAALGGVLSPEGGFVAFYSSASNLVSGDTNGDANPDVFLRERETGSTRRVSIASNGAESNGASGDTGIAISLRGEHVAFSSRASNLVPGDTNGVGDIFVHGEVWLILRSVLPATGSESGDDRVQLDGSGFTQASDLTVQFGDVPAAIVELTSRRIVVRSPSGTGTVDVFVRTPTTFAVLSSAYTFVDPAYAVRYGNVHQARGDREGVLLLNAVVGDTLTREMQVAVNRPLALAMQAPSSRSSARFALYAWAGIPNAATMTELPRGLGRIVFPTPLAGALPQPIAIWNNAGHLRTLGHSTLPSHPAPSLVFSFPRGVVNPARVTFQGIIEDDGSQIPEGWSVTNAIVLRVVP